MKRIEDNERRLDILNDITLNLDKYLNEFENNISNYYLLNDYYGSKKWLKDKDDFEKGKYVGVKAGVLSEDAVWNLDETTRDLINRMKNVVEMYEKNTKK